MAIRAGDIVVIGHRPGERWVVRSIDTASPSGAPQAWLTHPAEPHPVGHRVSVSGLILTERPTFAPGERVTVNGRSGTVAAVLDGAVRVMLDATRKETRAGADIAIPEGQADVSVDLLVIENRRI